MQKYDAVPGISQVIVVRVGMCRTAVVVFLILRVVDGSGFLQIGLVVGEGIL